MDYLPEPALPVLRTAGGNAAFHNFHNDFSHIQDANLRRRLVLRECDNVPFGWYHIRAVTVAGIGFFTDSYDIFAVNLITNILGMVYWQGPPTPGSKMGGNHGVLPTPVNTAIKTATSGGTVVGMLLFGWLADRLGRKENVWSGIGNHRARDIGTIPVCPKFRYHANGFIDILESNNGDRYWWRLPIVGSHYFRTPTTLIFSRFAPTRWRGAMMAAVFSMQGAGQLACSIVALVTTIAFKESFLNTTTSWSSCHEDCQRAGDRAWRIIVGFGAVPAIFALYYRITIPETPRYTFDIKHDIEKADADVLAYRNNQKEGIVDPVIQQKTKARIGSKLSVPPASWQDALSYFSQARNLKTIFATCASWFLLDFAFYGITLNNTTVLRAIGFSNGATIYDTLVHSAIGNLVLICAGSIPGYWMSVATIDTIGRKTIQVMGFFILTIIFCIIGFAYHSLSKGALLALYILAQLFFNFGPNTTTFIIPGECFPTRYRSTGHGISAASGKIGAIVSQVIAQPLFTKGASPTCSGSGCSPWLNHLMQIFALFMLCGTLVSLLVPETKGRTLEELAGEGSTPLDQRNGSITLDDGNWLRRHNPFRGGRPAGFSWNRSPALAPKSPGILGKRERLGIMASPHLLTKQGEKTQRHGRAASDTSASGGGYTVSVSSHGRAANDPPDDDLYIQGSQAGLLPGWGAGWAVERHPRPNGAARIESIKLQDVGMLLK